MSAKTGLVLSGGGARGAYEVGVVAGIVDVLGMRPADAPPFAIYAGTSVGAINAAYLASRSDRGDLEIEGLVEQWARLRMVEHLRVDLLGVLGWPRSLPFRLRSHQLDPESMGPRFGRSFLDPRPLEQVVREAVSWTRLHENIGAGRTQALVLAALHISSGQTHMFAELAPGAEFRKGRDVRRETHLEQIGPDHVLASSAIPMLFPSRRVGRAYYVDGGIRFNTPIAPAIRAGADRLVVVSLRRGLSAAGEGAMENYPNPVFLLGKLLAALLLDPVDYDLAVLARLNKLMSVLDETLEPEALARFQKVVDSDRGASYRKLNTLVFRPSRDIGQMAGTHLRDRQSRERADILSEFFLARAANVGETFESDLMSFLLFDGVFALKLIELGRHDARSRRDEVRAFFGA